MDDLLQQGITAYKAGNRDEARKIFITVVKQSPDSEPAWGWMYQVSNNDNERIHCLKQILRINPESKKASGLLSQLSAPSPDSILPSRPTQINPPVISTKKCPYCAESIQADAKICKHCGKDVAEKTTSIKKNTKSNKNAVIGVSVAVIIFCSFCVIANLLSSNRANEKGCARIEIFYCGVNSYGGDVKGTVTNTCNYNLRYVKVVSEIYSSNGELLDSDPEYIENLSPAETKNFESPFSSPSKQVDKCEAHAEEAGR